MYFNQFNEQVNQDHTPIKIIYTVFKEKLDSQLFRRLRDGSYSLGETLKPYVQVWTRIGMHSRNEDCNELV